MVAGAGMAGLVAAVRLRELGVTARVVEKGTHAGGSMLLSSCVPWRHREWADFRRECPGGDERLQRVVWERFDEALAWLERQGVEPVWRETGNPLTVGKRFDPRRLTAALLARLATPPELGAPWDGRGEAVLLATGGFAASPELVERYIRPAAPLRRRGNRWSTGDALALGLERGAALSGAMGEFYGRNMPDGPWGEEQFVPASQLYARFARIFDDGGVEFFRAGDVSWSEANVVQATARRPNARAYYLVGADGLAQRVRDRTVAELLEPAQIPLAELPFDPPAGTVAAARVVASITHTVGGLRIDARTRVLGTDGRPLDGLHAAGVDAGGIAGGGYASGLAQALVQGFVAAEELAGAA